MNSSPLPAGLPYSRVAPEPIASISRVEWVDTAKGFGIILVVFGHALRGLISSGIIPATPTFRFVDGWIYGFHMPLFFFLSGLFLYRSTTKPWTEFAVDKIRTIVYPYFVWSVITLLIKGAVGGLANHPETISESPSLFFKPIDQFWFLYALFILLMVSSAALKLGCSSLTIFVSAILVYPGLFSIPLLGSGILIETRFQAVYLALGLLCGGEQNIRTISDASVRSLMLVGAGGVMLSSLAGWSELPPWSELPYGNAFRARFAFAVSGIGAVVALAILAEKANFGSSVRFLGRRSLEIYVAHMIASAGARIALLKLAHISTPLPQLALGTLVGLYVPIAIALLFERVGFQFGFVFPKNFRLARTRQAGAS